MKALSLEHDEAAILMGAINVAAVMKMRTPKSARLRRAIDDDTINQLEDRIRATILVSGKFLVAMSNEELEWCHECLSICFAEFQGERWREFELVAPYPIFKLPDTRGVAERVHKRIEAVQREEKE